MRVAGWLVTAFALVAVTGAAVGRDGAWRSAWGSAQMRIDGADAGRIAAAGPVTLRQTVRLSAGGERLRVRLSNAFGVAPLVIDRARVAAALAPREGRSGAAAALTFGGRPAVTIAPGAEIASDPIAMPVAAGDDLSISLFMAQPPTAMTGHPGSRATAFVAAGDVGAMPVMPGAKPIGGWWQLADVEVEGAGNVIVAIGDSITDGYGIRIDSNTRWPDILSDRLRGDPRTRTLSVVNAGIGGNRVLLDGLGPSLVSRFERDVLGRSGVRYAIVFEGVNDLGVLTRDAPVDAAGHSKIVAAITDAYRQMAGQARARGITLIGATITPFVGNDYYHPGPATEADRVAINDFIRTSGVFAAIVDFDQVVRDPDHPDRLLPAYDSGDHLHPSEAGYRAIGDAVPLALFGGAPASPGKSALRPMIALTFDDMPAHGPLPIGDSRLAIAQKIIAATTARRIVPFGFLNGAFGADDPQSPAVIAAWRAAGYPIGNHSFTHGNLDSSTAAAFLGDVAGNEPILRSAMATDDWHWFRYPFLVEGSDPTKRDAVRAGLRASGYRVAAVTMSFGDYGWNDAYARCVAKRDDKAIARLEASFLDAARVQALRARALAKGALGRDIPYVLLMHLGAFDARMLPRLLDLYDTMGFGFTTLQRAESDPFYRAATDLSEPGPSPTLEAAAYAKGVSLPPNAALPDASICAR